MYHNSSMSSITRDTLEDSTLPAACRPTGANGTGLFCMRLVPDYPPPEEKIASASQLLPLLSSSFLNISLTAITGPKFPFYKDAPL